MRFIKKLLTNAFSIILGEIKKVVFTCVLVKRCLHRGIRIHKMFCHLYSTTDQSQSHLPNQGRTSSMH